MKLLDCQKLLWTSAAEDIYQPAVRWPLGQTKKKQHRGTWQKKCKTCQWKHHLNRWILPDLGESKKNQGANIKHIMALVLPLPLACLESSPQKRQLNHGICFLMQTPARNTLLPPNRETADDLVIEQSRGETPKACSHIIQPACPCSALASFLYINRKWLYPWRQ